MVDCCYHYYRAIINAMVSNRSFLLKEKRSHPYVLQWWRRMVCVNFTAHTVHRSEVPSGCHAGALLMPKPLSCVLLLLLLLVLELFKRNESEMGVSARDGEMEREGEGERMCRHEIERKRKRGTDIRLKGREREEPHEKIIQTSSFHHFVWHPHKKWFPASFHVLSPLKRTLRPNQEEDPHGLRRILPLSILLKF